MNQQAQGHLDEVMDEFDFAKVARAMAALNWRWISVEGGGVPSERHIRATVRGYAKRAIEDALLNKGHKPGKGFVGTGGFHVEATAKGGQLIGLYIRFTIADWSTEE